MTREAGDKLTRLFFLTLSFKIVLFNLRDFQEDPITYDIRYHIIKLAIHIIYLQYLSLNSFDDLIHFLMNTNYSISIYTYTIQM